MALIWNAIIFAAEQLRFDTNAHTQISFINTKQWQYAAGDKEILSELLFIEITNRDL